MKTASIPPPEPRTTKRRLPEEAKTMQAGESIGCARETANCIAAYGRRQGWAMAVRSEGKAARVWRIS